MVRAVYLIWGEKSGKIMRVVWALFMLVILLLVLKRLDIFYAEYIWAFNLFTALLFPFYIYLAVMYKEQILIIAQNYAEKITGFNGVNVFEGEKWPK